MAKAMGRAGVTHRWVLGFASALTLGACGGDDAQSDGSASGASEESGTGGETEGNGTGDGDTDGETGDDGGPGECILWTQDCPADGTKCMPWSEQADGTPDATKCCAEAQNPRQPGDECTVQQYDGSCLDDCELGTVCTVDKPQTLEGICTEICDPDTLDCGPGAVCKPFFEMIENAAIVPLCMPKCDPLGQDCDQQGRPGWTCLPDAIVNTQFICTPPPSETPKDFGDSCTLANECKPGMFCAPDAILDDCQSETGFCCTFYCDINEMPDICPDPLTCTDFDSPYPEWEHVGACVVPAGPGN